MDVCSASNQIFLPFEQRKKVSAIICAQFCCESAKDTQKAVGADFMPTIALVDDDRNILTSVAMALEIRRLQGSKPYTDGGLRFGRADG